MSLGRRVVLGAAWGQAGYMVAFALATLLQIILARGLGTNQYGLYAAVNGIAYLALSVAAGGVMPTLNTHLSRMEHEYGRAGAAYLFWRLWAWRLIIFSGAGLAIVVFAKPLAAGLLGSSDESDLIIAGAFYLISIGLFQIVNMLFFGLLRTKWGALGNVLSAAANVGISSVLIWQGASLPTLFAGLAVGQIVVTLIQLLRAWPSVRLGPEVADLPRAARRDVASLWRFSTTVWMTGMLTYALGKQTDIFTMQILRTPQAEVGFYNLAVTLAISANTILLAGHLERRADRPLQPAREGAREARAGLADPVLGRPAAVRAGAGLHRGLRRPDRQGALRQRRSTRSRSSCSSTSPS